MHTSSVEARAAAIRDSFVYLQPHWEVQLDGFCRDRFDRWEQAVAVRTISLWPGWNSTECYLVELVPFAVWSESRQWMTELHGCLGKPT